MIRALFVATSGWKPRHASDCRCSCRLAPGTFAYVYAGRVGKALTMESATSEPWYVYLGGMVVVVTLLKIAGDVATGVIDAMEEDDGL